MAAIKNETVEARIARLGISEEDAKGRIQSLTIAHAAGVSDRIFKKIGQCWKISRESSIVLPATTTYSHLSRGRDWCRGLKNNQIIWGVKVEEGYEVSEPGKWECGSSDGFKRSNKVQWVVEHLEVGNQIWTIAN